MPLIYETTATIGNNGHLSLDMDDLPFEAGTKFLVQLIPQVHDQSEIFKTRMRAFIEQCASQNPYKNMSAPEILAELRRQREEMYGESAANQP